MNAGAIAPFARDEGLPYLDATVSNEMTNDHTNNTKSIHGEMMRDRKEMRRRDHSLDLFGTS
jgi:hypothetical protein